PIDVLEERLSALLAPDNHERFRLERESSSQNSSVATAAARPPKMGGPQNRWVLGGLLPGHDARASKMIVLNADDVKPDRANSIAGRGEDFEGRPGSSIAAALIRPPSVPNPSGVSVGDDRREEILSPCRVGVLASQGMVRPSQVA
ncbi:unnamed protein product, partial [Sphacelaria rigidula]